MSRVIRSQLKCYRNREVLKSWWVSMVPFLGMLLCQFTGFGTAWLTDPAGSHGSLIFYHQCSSRSCHFFQDSVSLGNDQHDFLYRHSQITHFQKEDLCSASLSQGLIPWRFSCRMDSYLTFDYYYNYFFFFWKIQINVHFHTHFWLNTKYTNVWDFMEK